MSVIDGFKGLIVPTGISLNTSSSTIKIGYPLQLVATITPSGATNQNIKWTSSNTNIATVENGLVTPVAVGNCTITATTEYGNYTDTCSCTITVVHTTGVSLNESSIKIAKGKTFQLEATVTPSDTSYPQVTWSSSNTSVATVSQDGLVTCVGSVDGNCTITCTTVDGGYTATCEVIQGRAPGSNTIVYLPLEGDLSRYGRYSTGAVNIGSDTPYEDIFGNIQGIRFKGNNNSYIQITDVPVMDTDFTLNFWALLYTNNSGVFVERGTSNNTNCRLHYVIRNTTKVDLGFYANDCPGTTNTVNGVWYNFTATYNHTTREQKVYINGALDGSRTGSGDPAFGSGALNLGGAHSFTTGDNANCTMSRFIWEDRIWSETDINDYIDLTISDYQDKIENYQEVEYIQSSGNGTNNGQFIKPDVPVSSGVELKIQTKFTNLNSATEEREVFATYGGGVNLQCNITSNAISINNWSSYTITPDTTSNGTTHILEATYTGGGSSSRNPFLFAQNEGDSYGRWCCSIKLYYFKIYQNNVLVRDFMPCYRKSDGVIGLFDKVNNIFYTNSGNGTFTAGPKIGISLDKNNLSLTEVGQTYQLTVTPNPVSIGAQGYQWRSSDISIATVSNTGLVTCVIPGECTITCTAVNGGYTDTCTIKQGWGPGVNTLLYVPMYTDLLDYSGNNIDITNYGISINDTVLSNIGVGYFKGSSDDRLEFSGITFGTNSFTISRWEKTNSTSGGSGSRFSSARTTGSWAGLLLGYYRTNLYAGSGTSWNVIDGASAFNSNTEDWVHWTVIRDGNNRKTYRNKTLYWSGTASGSVGYNTDVIGNYRPGDRNPYNGYMSRFIIESSVWDENYISEYIDLTKADYR